MSLTGFKASNHPQQVAVSGPDDDVDDRATHPLDFGPLNDRFGFTVDVAAAAHNTKCERFYDRETDGLSQSWGGGGRLVQSTILRPRPVDPEGVGRTSRRHDRHAHPGQQDRAEVLTIHD